MTGIVLAASALVLALVPCLCFVRNLRLYRPPPDRPAAGGPPARPSVSVLIPARNEERTIGGAVEAALAGRDVDLEVLVLDDGSEDATAEVVRRLEARDGRLRLVPGRPLPAGWCGKPHACSILGSEARGDILVFVDADVRLAPDACARMAAFLDASGASLASGVPEQVTGTFLEKLLIPLIHFLLLGFLPLRRMRRSRHPCYGAGCGQLFAARRQDYFKAGGHEAVRATLHDGLKLPRAFRAAGLATDIFDATSIATCRMYESAAGVWRGLAKNATEGLAAPRTIVPATLLLLGGQVLPMALIVSWPALPAAAIALALAAAACAYVPRIVGVLRFRQSILGAALHPLGVLVLLAIQWHAFARKLAGRSESWRGRAYPAGH